VLGQRALELAAVAETGERIADRPLLRFEHGARGGKAGPELRDEALQLIGDGRTGRELGPITTRAPIAKWPSTSG